MTSKHQMRWVKANSIMPADVQLGHQSQSIHRRSRLRQRPVQTCSMQAGHRRDREEMVEEEAAVGKEEEVVEEEVVEEDDDDEGEELFFLLSCLRLGCVCCFVCRGTAPMGQSAAGAR